MSVCELPRPGNNVGGGLAGWEEPITRLIQTILRFSRPDGSGGHRLRATRGAKPATETFPRIGPLHRAREHRKDLGVVVRSRTERRGITPDSRRLGSSERVLAVLRPTDWRLATSWRWTIASRIGLPVRSFRCRPILAGTVVEIDGEAGARRRRQTRPGSRLLGGRPGRMVLSSGELPDDTDHSLFGRPALPFGRPPRGSSRPAPQSLKSGFPFRRHSRPPAGGPPRLSSSPSRRDGHRSGPSDRASCARLCHGSRKVSDRG